MNENSPEDISDATILEIQKRVSELAALYGQPAKPDTTPNNRNVESLLANMQIDSFLYRLLHRNSLKNLRDFLNDPSRATEAYIPENDYDELIGVLQRAHQGVMYDVDEWRFDQEPYIALFRGDSDSDVLKKQVPRIYEYWELITSTIKDKTNDSSMPPLPRYVLESFYIDLVKVYNDIDDQVPAQIKIDWIDRRIAEYKKFEGKPIDLIKYPRLTQEIIETRVKELTKLREKYVAELIDTQSKATQ